MSYDIQLVELQATSFALSALGIPWPTTPFPFLLYSGWHCNSLGLLPGSANSGGSGSSLLFGQTLAFTIEVSRFFPNTTVCIVSLRNFGHSFYEGTFTLPGNDCQNHVMVSVNCLTQTVQVFANDVAAPVITGVWTGSDLMNASSHPDIVSTDVDVGSIGGNYPAIADLWCAATPTWVDISVTANRRKFINHNLSPVSLALDGSKPFGYQPPVFLSCETGTATDIATNYGSGGPFGVSGFLSAITLQAGVCTVLSIPSPPIGISFAEVYDPAYLDFTDEDYISFALSAFVMNPQAPITKVQAPYLVFYFNTDARTNEVDMHFRWGFAQNSNSGKFSSVQRLSTTDTINFQYQGLRRKVRGSGRAFQVGFFSVTGQPFDVTGWVIENSMNTQA